MTQTIDSFAITTPDGRFLEVNDGLGRYSARFGTKEEAYAEIERILGELTEKYLVAAENLPQYVIAKQTQTISDWETVNIDDLTAATVIGDTNDEAE